MLNVECWLFIFLNTLAETRKAWLSLAIIATAFELIALYFQHALGLTPCIMCIYQRTAMLGLVAAGLIGEDILIKNIT